MSSTSKNIIIVVMITSFILILSIVGINLARETKFYKEEFEYLRFPNYNTYLNTVDKNLKSAPYYKFDKEPLNIPVFYNYLLPNIPSIDMSKCPSNSILQYWYTPQ